MKEKILEAFRALGFQLEEVEVLGYSFKYEGLHFLYMYNERHEEFLSIALPGIFDVEKERMLKVYTLLERINSKLKYVKAYMFGKGVWLFYERELIGDENLVKVISHMIRHLEYGIDFARKEMVEIEKTMAKEELS